MKIKFHLLLKMAFVIFIAVLLSLFMNNLGIRKENTVLIFIVSVLLISSFSEGYFYGILSSLISVLCFNYFFTLPHYDFHMSDQNDIVLIIFFLIVSFIGCNLTERLQKQIAISKNNEMVSKKLYDLSEKLINVSGIDNILHQGEKFIADSIQVKTKITLDHIQESYLISSMHRTLGSIEVLSPDNLNDEQVLIIKAAANQLASAIERELTYQKQEEIKVEMEKEHMLNSMLKSISHDLRTPLTGIIGASQLIENSEKLDQNDIKLLIHDIYEQSVWLKQMVENILNKTKIDSGGLIIQKNIEVVDDIILEATSCVDFGNIELKVVTPDNITFVSADGKLLVQVFINLLNNAIRFSNNQGLIWIIVEDLDHDILFTIKDEGKGIHPTIIDHLFDEFVTYPPTGDQKGMGLGLSICKSIIEAHGGCIWAQNNEDKGACFMFKIPKERSLS